MARACATCRWRATWAVTSVNVTPGPPYERTTIGYEVSAETVRCYRRRALRRPPSRSWRSFLANHRPQLRAADCCTVQTRTCKTLYGFFFITPARRRIVHFNVTAHPTAPCVWRQLLEATPWGQQPRYLIRDRDRSSGGAFLGRARAIGIKTVLTAVRAPQANASAERVVGTLRRACLDHLIIVNERHLRLVLREYVAHYNHVRPCQALELWASDDRRPPVTAPERGPSRGSADPGRAASRVRASRRVTFGRTTFSGSTAISDDAVVRLARQYGVSQAATAFRLANLGLAAL